MKIHNGLLTHNATDTDTTTGMKILDLGFNGDFDEKKTDWNYVFAAFSGVTSGTALTMKVYSKQSGITTDPVLVNDSNLIGTLVIPAATVQKGGVVGIPMPKNLKRYFTIAFTGTAATIPDTITAGITDVVDSDLSLNWTNYKAETGSSDVTEVREANTADIAAHAALTTGVHGLS